VSLTSSERRIVTAVGGGWLQRYVRVKLTSDPVYRAALRILEGRPAPLLDVGAGIGILPFFLQAHDYLQPTICLEQDQRKIDVGRRMAGRLGAAHVQYVQQDVRQPLPFSGNVAMLDVLHYLGGSEQEQLLARAAAHASQRGHVVIIRDCLRDGSWRFRATQLQEGFSKAVRWLKSDRFDFPGRDALVRTMEAHGMRALEVSPLWGRTPFNNYLLVFERR
jgi:hypothetical protein